MQISTMHQKHTRHVKSLLLYAYGKQYVECRIQASKHDLDTDYDCWMANTQVSTILILIMGAKWLTRE